MPLGDYEPDPNAPQVPLPPQPPPPPGKYDPDTLRIGQDIWDMHNGFPDIPKLLGPKAYPDGETHIDVPGGCKIIQTILRAHLEKDAKAVLRTTYTNKMLVFVGQGEHRGRWTLQFAYSYDDNGVTFLRVIIPYGE